MKIFMTGGTGFVGATLAKSLAEQGHEVTILTRAVRKDRATPKGVRFVEGDPIESGPWQSEVPGHDAIVNLAGASIFTRWTDQVKQTLRDSRILTTRNVVQALGDLRGKETLLLSTSAVGYYGFHGDEDLDEQSPPGEDFLATLCRDWEKEALRAREHGARVILCRLGIVLGRKGGALEKILSPFRWGLGSNLGSGRQWFSWIHEKDLVQAYLFLLRAKGIEGPVNCAAPDPVRNSDLTRAIGKALKKPTFMPAVPGFVLKAVMGEFGSVLLEGQKVLPKALLKAGFTFRFPALQEALSDLIP
jgi:hypothetical protein